MKKNIFIIILAILTISIVGCANKDEANSNELSENSIGHSQSSDTKDTSSINNSLLQDEVTTQIIDFSDCFDGLNGSAVFYNKKTNEMKVYNDNESETQYSPCSTFKIISTLLGLEHGIITDKNSTMKYNGTLYSVDSWNENLSLDDAFQTSCVWYFKQVIEEIDKNVIQKTLTDLEYGNCDISEWNGSGLNPSPELNGFWLESSLKISPKEQVNVLSKIFDGETGISENSISLLKDIMLLDNKESNSIYGKTGTGKSNSWFVGFFESEEQRWYFAVNIQNDSQATGKKAQEVTLSIIDKYF